MNRGRGGITADFDGGLELQEVGLREEDLLGGGAELLDLRLGQLRVLPGLEALHLQQPGDDVVQQRRIHPLLRQSRASQQRRQLKEEEEENKAIPATAAKRKGIKHRSSKSRSALLFWGIGLEAAAGS